MVVEMAVTGTVVQIEHQINEYEFHQADMLLVCELEDGGEGLRAASEGLTGMTLGVLGARVRVVDDWGLPGLGEVQIGDFVYACGSWQAPGSHDLVQEMRFLEAARDWYRLESWDAGEAGRLEVRAVEIIGYDVRRFNVNGARWERLTEEWRSWWEPHNDDAAWSVHQNVHRLVVGEFAREPVAALDSNGNSMEWKRPAAENEIDTEAADRERKREALAEVSKLPEVKAQKKVAHQLAQRRRKAKRGKRGKRKRRK